MSSFANGVNASQRNLSIFLANKHERRNIKYSGRKTNKRRYIVPVYCFRPKWAAPGIVFLRFLAKSTHLQLLAEEDYKKLLKEMPAALDALYGNPKDSLTFPTLKGKVRENFDIYSIYSLCVKKILV